MGIKYKLNDGSIEFLVGYQIGNFELEEKDFLAFQQAFKEALFEYCNKYNKQLGECTGTKEGT